MRVEGKNKAPAEKRTCIQELWLEKNRLFTTLGHFPPPPDDDGGRSAFVLALMVSHELTPSQI